MADEEIRIGLSVVSDAGTRKTIQDLADVRKKINELKNEFKSGAKDADTFAKEFADLEKQAKKLDKALDEVGEKRRLDIDTGKLAEPSQAGSGLRQFGREVRNLPSVQIPGAGFGTDAVGNLLRVSGSLTEITATSKTAAAASALLTPALGAQTAATIAAYAPIALLVGGLAAIGLAIKTLVDETSKNAAQINTYAESQRELNNQIASGLTSDEARAKLEELTVAQERQKATQAELQQAYNDAEIQLRQATLGGVNLGNAFSNTAKIFSGDEEALVNQISETQKTVQEYQGEIDALTGALEDGSLAANDAKIAEEKLAEARTQGVLREAQQAGELASLKERAADLTQEQIDSELEALERRRVGIEAELESLQQSGDTSEAVTKKIADLEESLKFLGEQTDVLSKARVTALSDEAKKAQKDAEKAKENAEKEAQKRLEQTAKAQQNYNDKLADVSQRFRDSIADIGVSLKDNLADNTRKLQDDLNKESIEFNQDQLKEETKFQRDLAQIKEESARAEQDAVKARDFAALAETRRSGQDELTERQQAEQLDNQEQLADFIAQRQAMAMERDLANRDDLIAAQRAERDAKTQRDRANRDAATDRDRALRDINAMEQTYQRNSLNNWQNYFDQLLGLQQRATSGGASGGNTPTTNNRTRSNATMGFDDFATVVLG